MGHEADVVASRFHHRRHHRQHLPPHRQLTLLTKVMIVDNFIFKRHGYMLNSQLNLIKITDILRN